MAGILHKPGDHYAWTDALACAVFLVMFSFFSTAGFPVKIISLGSLFGAALVMVNSRNRPFLVTVIKPSGYIFNRQFVFLFTGLLMGSAGALYYRTAFGLPAMPSSLSLFACFSVCIGMMEEFVFRGFLQQRLHKYHPAAAISFAALAHALYKVALFISPWSQWHPGPFIFFIISFLAFNLLGVLKHYSKSIWPPVMAHIVFDVWVYAETTHPPWWVW